jgi:hypothetical protein
MSIKASSQSEESSADSLSATGVVEDRRKEPKSTVLASDVFRIVSEFLGGIGLGLALAVIILVGAFFWLDATWRSEQRSQSNVDHPDVVPEKLPQSSVDQTEGAPDRFSPSFDPIRNQAAPQSMRQK